MGDAAAVASVSCFEAAGQAGGFNRERAGLPWAVALLALVGGAVRLGGFGHERVGDDIGVVGCGDFLVADGRCHHLVGVEYLVGVVDAHPGFHCAGLDDSSGFEVAQSGGGPGL